MIKNYLSSWKTILTLNVLKSRLQRKAFWSWAFMHVVAYVLLLAVVVFTMGGDEQQITSRLSSWPSTIIFNGFFLAPFVLQMIRRLHDANRSAWWLLILFLANFVGNFLKYPPVIGVGALLVSAILILPSVENNNTFFK